MRNWKNWLFPILTALTVTALALLPLRLSTLEDSRLTGTVHAEDLSEDSNFPFKPPDLPGRLWLLVQWQEMPENITIMSHELEGAERDRAMAQLREALAELGSLLSPAARTLLSEIDGDSWEWSRHYLRDQTDLSSASFITASTYDQKQKTYLSATLDVESGQIVGLTFSNVNIEGIPCSVSSLELGKAILDRLGLDYTIPEKEAGDAVYFRLTDCESLFWVVRYWTELDFNFTVDWAAVDEELAASYGREPADASSMQKW